MHFPSKKSHLSFDILLELCTKPEIKTSGGFIYGITHHLCRNQLDCGSVDVLGKKSAKAKSWRVPEKVLFEIAVLGGGVGATFGMFRFRHKTKHWYFKLGFPILASLQIFLILYVLLP